MQYAPNQPGYAPYVVVQSQHPQKRPGFFTRVLCCCCPSGVQQRFSRLNGIVKCCILLPCFLVLLAILAVIALLIFLNVSVSQPSDAALAVISSNSAIRVEQMSSTYIVRPAIGSNSTNSTATRGLIFIPGFKVDPRSYFPLAAKVATQGFMVALVQPPLNFPPFSYSRAYDVAAANPGVKFAIGGHGYGGTTAAAFMSSRSRIPGVVAFALIGSANSGTGLSQETTMEAVSVTASADPWFSPAYVEKFKSYNPPKTEYVTVDGGNHAQFGSYGAEKGDGAATVSEDQQQSTTATAIVAMLKKL